MPKTPMRPNDVTPVNPYRRLALHGAASVLLGSAGLAGCGGSDASDPILPSERRRQPLGGVDSGGTGSPMAFFSAAITDTAPLSVAGVSFDTSGCSITDGDGQALALHELAPGMTGHVTATSLKLGGSQPSARALQLSVAEQLRGPVVSVDAAAQSLTLLGQRVQLSARTVFDAALAAGPVAIQGGMRLRVWGELDVSGARIVATRVALAQPYLTFIVRGVLSGLDGASGLLTMGAMQARFEPGAPGIASVPVGTVVRASLGANADGNLTLLALREDSLRVPDQVHAEIEGRITRVDSTTRFAVDGVVVDASALASLPAPLLAGARAAVQGRMNQGLLRASSVAIEPEEPVELEGSISATDAMARSFVVKGVTIVWSSATRFEGDTAKLLKPKRRVAVIGHWNAGRSHVEATRLHIEA